MWNRHDMSSKMHVGNGQIHSLNAGSIAPLPCLEFGMQQSIFVLCCVRPCLELPESGLELIRLRSTLQHRVTEGQASEPRESALPEDVRLDIRAAWSYTGSCQHSMGRSCGTSRTYEPNLLAAPHSLYPASAHLRSHMSAGGYQHITVSLAWLSSGGPAEESPGAAGCISSSAAAFLSRASTSAAFCSSACFLRSLAPGPSSGVFRATCLARAVWSTAAITASAALTMSCTE